MPTLSGLSCTLRQIPADASSCDPSVRTWLIHRLAPLGADPTILIRHLSQEQDVSCKRAMILSLGEFDANRVPAAEIQPLIAYLVQLYRSNPDPGLHAAIDWLLRQPAWNQAGQISQIDGELQLYEKQLQMRKATDERRWYVNRQGQTFVILHPDKAFLMGSPDNEPGRIKNEVLHKQRIGRTFAIAAKLVTKSQYRKFQQTNPRIWIGDIDQWSRTDDSPQAAVDWHDAVRYCNWLSEVEGIPKEQWCYQPNNTGEAMKPVADYLLAPVIDSRLKPSGNMPADPVAGRAASTGRASRFCRNMPGSSIMGKVICGQSA